ncbi:MULTISPECIES: hypothetical protein [unclassified Vibrio]|nr:MULTISPECIES: hypothetical protein [unclassified Vibrio]
MSWLSGDYRFRVVEIGLKWRTLDNKWTSTGVQRRITTKAALRQKVVK